MDRYGPQAWRALLSDADTHARDRVAIAGRVVNAIGEVLADDFNDLWDGSIDRPVKYNEQGFPVPNNTVFWTGSNQFGYSSQHAQNWQQISSQQANFGLSNVTNLWFNQGTTRADEANRLSCLCEARVIDPGDFNDDGLVDAADYIVWRMTMGDTVARGVQADGDGDGTITPLDLNVWRAHFGTNYLSGAASSSSTAAPEPPSLSLLLIAATAVLPRRRVSPKLAPT